MAGLFDDVVALLADRSSMRYLSTKVETPDPPALRTATVLAAPVAIARLADSLQDPARAASTTTMLQAVQPSALQSGGTLGDIWTNGHRGDLAVEHLFAQNRGRVADAIAAEAGVSPQDASRVLDVSVQAVFAVMASRYSGHLNDRTLGPVMAGELKDMSAKGWDPWLESTAGGVDAAETADVQLTPRPETHRTVQQAAPASERAVGSSPPPAAPVEPVRPSPPSPPALTKSAPVPPPAVEPVAATTREPTTDYTAQTQRRAPATPTRQYERPADVDGSSRRSELLKVVGGVAFVLVALAAIAAIQYWGNSTSDGVDASGADADSASSQAVAIEQDDTAAESEGAEPTAGADATDEETAAAGAEDVDDPVDVAAADTPAELDFSIPMFDPLQRAEATGVAELQLDPDAGQVCWTVESDGLGAPYDGHIHVGPAGVKGGIVVDFGPVNNGEMACTDVAVNDILAIVASPSGHYVEMHDPSGDFTIREQLSDEPMEAPPEGGLAFDPTGSGATTLISSGQIVLEGPVPDQETMDQLIFEVSGLDESRILVVNDLEVVDGADRPTGLITVADAILFDVGSADLDPANTVIEDLALLFAARSEWTMAIIGHTDSSGDDVLNLELSLQRAASVRDALVGFGIDAARLRTQGAGSTAPVAPNDTEEGRQLNRRIEFRVDRS